MRTRNRPASLVLVVLVVGLIALLPSNVPGQTSPLAGAEGSLLAREPQVTPQQLGVGQLDGLQYADPLERVDLIEPPVANNQGTAQLSHPLFVPPGRGDATVDLSIDYSSTSENGWLGLGWDIGVGEVSVDTRWGVPRYDGGKETETYALDGSTLSPTAVRSVLLDREEDRTFTRRSEGDFERIQRHGSSPGNYWWEVTDKSATTRYYGARWDEATEDFVRDPASILADDSGHEFRWGLSQVVDISGNTVNYFYDMPTGSGVGANDEEIGRQLYLDRITFAGSIGVGNPDDPAYEVRFVRDSDLGEPRRTDVTVDARGGFLEVTSDLLRKVEFYHRGSLTHQYVLSYTQGAFAKTVLASIARTGSDQVVYAAHNFDYYDDVREGGSYSGFSGETSWDTGSDLLSEDLVESIAISALGGTLSVAADVRAYLGFNPSNPTKDGSFGGAVAVKAGDSFALAEMMDINGDNLPDKVYLKGGDVKFRLNQGGASNGSTTFGGEQTAASIDTLSNEVAIEASAGPEAYVGLSAQFNVAASVSIGEVYFSDVNFDGLPDLVSSGRVHFNHLDNGIPTFEENSGLTSVPIEDAFAGIFDLEQLEDLEQQVLERSPLMDTVRRWIAPFAGTVSIAGPVTLAPPPGTDSGDGVRVAIQHGPLELWSATLSAAGQSATPTGVGAVTVTRGQAIYFRVGSILDGAGDRVTWDPVIEYTSLSGDPDANGLSQTRYVASEDFTLAGRPDSKILMPLDGTVRFETTLFKSAKTSDDIRVLVLHNGTAVLDQVIAHDAIHTTGLLISADFDVLGPRDTDDDEVPDEFDEVVVRIAVDSPIDVTVLSWAPKLTYTNPLPASGPLEVEVPWDIDIYPNNDLLAPRAPWVSSISGTATVRATVTHAFLTNAGTATLTVKNEAGLVGKFTFNVPLPPAVTWPTVNFELGQKYWFDISVRDRNLGEEIGTSVALDQTSGTTAVPSTRNWSGPQSVFPLGYRGWAYAGYNAEGRAAIAIDEGAFVFAEADFPDRKPTGFDDTGYKDPTQGDSWPFIPYLLPDGAGGTVPVWRGFRDNQHGAAGSASSSRLSRDETTLFPPADENVRAVRRVSITPALALVLGVGPFGAGFGWGSSLGLQDYFDMNGDSFPDIITPNSIKYTGPRGGYYESSDPGSLDIVRNDTTTTLSAGFNGTAVGVNANSKGDANTSQDVAPVSSSGGGKKPSGGGSDGGDSNESQVGANLGGNLGVQASFSNAPLPGDSAASFATDLETELNDVNGDGLPDRVRVGDHGVQVSLNLGYDWAPEIEWADGLFENGETYGGSLGLDLGFNVSNYAFAGGVSFNQATNFMRTSWADLNGDGILDRLRLTGNEITVEFGTGAGLLPETDFGDFAQFQPSSAIPLEFGEQVGQDINTGMGIGGDFTIGIGPLCKVGCYIIINPGAHVDTSLSTQRIELQDVNGDGFPDSVSSSTDDSMGVRLNKTGRTNLLRAVHNPAGGEIRLGYTREGNTVAQPYSQWVLASVETDDNRPGDGPDTRLSTYAYAENVFNALEREFFGYRTVIEDQRAYAGDGNVFDDTVLRSYERTYRNSSVFEVGLLERERLIAPGGDIIKETLNSYQLADVDLGGIVDTAPTADDPAGVRLLVVAAFAERASTEQRWYEGGSVAQATRSLFEYDRIGNVIRIIDEGELELPGDDLTAVITYPDCTAPGESWAAIADSLVITGPGGEVLRRREGTMLCENGAVTELREDTGSGIAQIDLAFDEWGNYNHIVYPANADGERYTVDYIYDTDHHAFLARTEDSHGLVSEATYHPPTGEVASRRDANGQVTSYTYDAQGRLTSITGPYEQGTGHATVTYEYFPTDPAYSYAIARHFDVFNPGDTIDTARFMDGIGRETQTKQDATVFTGEGSAAADVMIVGGAVEFDALGRAIKNWYPTTEPLGSIGVYNTNATPVPTVTSYTLTDLVSQVVAPDGAVTTTDHGYGGTGLFGATLFREAKTDAEGRTQHTYSDVRQQILGIELQPGTPDSLLTRYEYDAFGQLLRVIDSSGNTTAHAYDLGGRRISTDTPDGGLVTFSYDTAANLIARQTPNLRATGTEITYSYDFDRLVAVDFPGTTPDVAYTYGGPGAPNNGAGRIVHLVDAARDQTMEYGRLGEVTKETTTMLVHNLNAATASRLTWTTQFEHEAFGRVKTMTYSDGEVVTYDYDAGGLVKSVVGSKLGSTYQYLDRLEYDEFNVRRYRETGTAVGTSYTYDELSRRLERIQTITPEREVQDWNYGYDLVGNVLTANNLLPAPKPNLMGGPSEQQFAYDIHYRLVSASGRYEFAPNKRREYTVALGYDTLGNIVSKSQTDFIFNNPNKGIEQKPTTYILAYERTATPHQITRIGSLEYFHDANGNFTGWDDESTGQNRTVAWNADDRAIAVANQGSTTTYTYDDTGRLAIERGPGGETAFVNRWYTVRNGAVEWKNIWAGDTRIATKRQFEAGDVVDGSTADPVNEHMLYFFHEDLLGSTNIVTDRRALVFQHLEYFPGGEIWVHEHGDVHRTPYLYTGEYYDEVRQLVNLGQRWYEPREQFFYRTDPILTEDPEAVRTDPALLAAYSYAQNNPLRLKDRDGRAPEDVQALFRAAFGRPDGSLDPAKLSRLTSVLKDRSEQLLPNRATRLLAKAAADPGSAFRKSTAFLTDKLGSKPLVEVNLDRTPDGVKLRNLKLSPFFGFKQFRVKGVE